MKLGFLIVFLALLYTNTSAERIPGDLNGDGAVGFDDFLLFASNFGKTGGDPFDPQSLLRVPAPSGDANIPGLAAIEIVDSDRARFDADPEEDGWRVTIELKDNLGQKLSFPSTLTVNIVVEFYITFVGNNDSESETLYASAVSDTAFGLTTATIVKSSRTTFTIPDMFEEEKDKLLTASDVWLDALAREAVGQEATEGELRNYKKRFSVEYAHDQDLDRKDRMRIVVGLKTSTQTYKASDLFRISLD